MFFDGFKISLAVFILILTIIAGIYPFIKRNNNEQTNVDFSAAEALAGGIFFGAGLLHMLGSATSNFISLGFNYPWPFLISGGVFLSLLYLEHLSKHALKTQENNNVFVIIPLIMISLHSLFEGTALGLSSQVTLTLVIAFAIIAHKWAASFALAVQINKNGCRFKTGFSYFMIFALMTPIGIMLGNIVAQQLNQYKLLQPICDALAAGTFLYLGSIHGLNRAVMIEKCRHVSNLYYVLLGFSAMAIVAVWV